MITRQYPLEQTTDYPLERDFNLERIAFFDIETTGFAAESTYLYLIGCAYYKSGTFHLIQWFSENIREEALLISTFFEFLEGMEVLIHYNGSGFDIPYLQKKISMLKLNYSFDHLKSIDLYKKISPYKKIFRLRSFKLKSLEEFLQVDREDTASGGDLIQVYQSYLGKKNYETLYLTRNPESILPVPTQSDQLLHQLLLHNADDIRGLISICPILNYVDLFEKPIRILDAVVDNHLLHIHFEFLAKLPIRITYSTDLAQLTAFERQGTISVPIYEGELKHFYDNYKDYYYLPAEDYAIHKSVAGFVDKDHRVKAKPSTCYARKTGFFAPQYETLLSPYYKINYQDRITFLEVHTDCLLQENNLELYARNMLSHIITG